MSARHIFITGTGRAGTTMLVELLANLGFETSIDRSRFYPDASAGYEDSLIGLDPPYVVKNPREAASLRSWFSDGTVDPKSLDCVIVPIRDLEQATRSRIEQSTTAGVVRAPGGITGTWRPRRQHDVLVDRMLDLMLGLAEFNVPHLLIAYPRLALDPEYCFDALRPILGDVDRSSFEHAWALVSDPTKVHCYDEDLSVYGSTILLVSNGVRRGVVMARRVARRLGVRRSRPPRPFVG